MEQTLPRSPEEESALLTPWFWTSGLQNGERIDVCCFKPPNLQSSVTAAQRNKCGKSEVCLLTAPFILS